MPVVRIEKECDECEGRGLLKPDRFRLAYICYVCRGTGRLTYAYTPFKGRKVDVAGTVATVQWRTYGAGPPITYGAFLAGQMPNETGGA